MCADLSVDTRQTLLRIALFEFAQHGIEGVSLSKIRQLSGQANRSVMHYHFKTKEGLIEQVVLLVTTQLELYCAQALEEFRQEEANDYSLKQISELMFDPFVQLFSSGSVGAACIRFLSRLTWQTGQTGQRVLRDLLRPYLLQFEPRLQALMPNHSDVQLRMKLYLAVNTAIHGLADFSIMQQDDKLQPLMEQPENALEMRRLFHDYVSAGLQGNPR